VDGKVEGLAVSVAPFEQLLSALHPDRDRAGAQYRDLHHHLLAFFEWRSSRRPDEQADEVMDRVIRRIAEGERIDNLQTYAIGVAKLLLREERKHVEREEVARAQLLMLVRDHEPPADHDPGEEKQARFERCLEALSAQNRAIILTYYTGEGRAKIAARRQLAADLGMDLNALRVRAHRIRARLERCVENCLIERCNVFDCVATPK
jgi:DNA-directed RNA polymerase specialized sigma24 family protein